MSKKYRRAFNRTILPCLRSHTTTYASTFNSNSPASKSSPYFYNKLSTRPNTGTRVTNLQDSSQEDSSPVWRQISIVCNLKIPDWHQPFVSDFSKLATRTITVPDFLTLINSLLQTQISELETDTKCILLAQSRDSGATLSLLLPRTTNWGQMLNLTIAVDIQQRFGTGHMRQTSD